MEIFTIGTSSAVPTEERGLPCHLVRTEQSNILFDCGEGAQEQLMTQGLGIMDIDHVFISHWHADHFSGLIGLVQTLELEGRERKLHLYGPRGTKEFGQRLLNTGYFTRRYDIEITEMQAGSEVEVGDFKVKAFEVEHTIPAYGFTLEEGSKPKINKNKMEELGLSPSPKIAKLKQGETVEIEGRNVSPDQLVDEVEGRKLVYSGDTSRSENLIREAENADLLLHEATMLEESGEKKGHSSARMAGKIASEASVEKLVLTHISRRYKDSSMLLEEAKKEHLNVEVASDGDKFRIDPHRPE